MSGNQGMCYPKHAQLESTPGVDHTPPLHQKSLRVLKMSIINIFISLAFKKKRKIKRCWEGNFWVPEDAQNFVVQRWMRLKVLNVSNIEVDREAFGTMPGLTGKCSLSPRCYPLTKANLINLQDKDITDYGCQGEQLVKGEYSMGAYDYDWWPDTEIEGAKSTSVHWQQLPQPFGLHKHLDQLHEKNVLKKNLEDIRQNLELIMMKLGNLWKIVG